jgi:hypothetical protein
LDSESRISEIKGSNNVELKPALSDQDLVELINSKEYNSFKQDISSVSVKPETEKNKFEDKENLELQKTLGNLNLFNMTN